MRTLLAATALAVALTPAVAQAQDTCPNAQFRTGASAGLPDCRAWEQVSPLDKGGNPMDRSISAFSDASGDRVYSGSSGSPVPTEGAPKFRGFLSSRGDGWSTRATDPPSDPPLFNIGSTTFGISDDATKAVVLSTRVLAPGGVAGGANLYVRDLTKPASYTFIAAKPGLQAYGETAYGGVVYDSTPDFDTIVIASTLSLLPGLPEIGDNSYRYLYFFHDGKLTLASRLPDGTPSTVTADVKGPPDALHRLSDHGRTLTWSPVTPAQSISRTVLRTTRGGETVDLGRQRTGDDPLPPGGVTAHSTADASKTVFALVERVLPQSTPGFPAIYRYDAADDRLEDLTARFTRSLPAERDGEIAVEQVSADGTLIWFTTTIPFDGRADVGEPRLYVLDTAAERIDLVATLSNVFVGPDTFRFSPDGTRAAIRSFVPQTGAPTEDPACTFTFAEGTDGVCPQIYTFDARRPSAPLTCVSCSPAGRAPGIADFDYAPLVALDDRLPRVILDDGRTFFDTTARLVDADVNSLPDVYEYVPGTGPAMLTTGASGDVAKFARVSADGRSVFAYTAQALVPQDVDGLTDVYVARAGGGLAAQQTAPSADVVQPCEGESCRAAPGSEPARPAPGTSRIAPPRVRRVPRFSVVRPTARALRAAARSGRLTLAVKVTAPGTVTAGLRAKVGGRDRSVGSSSRRASKAQTVRLPLRLSRQVRRKLLRTGDLSLHLTVAYSERLTRYRTTLTLKRSGAR